MDETQSVPQVKFSSLDDFIDNNNNYYSIWILDSACGENRRKVYPAYKRMHERYPEFSRKLFEKASEMWKVNRNFPWKKCLPWEDLFISYELMSKLVYEKDCLLTG